MLNVELLIPTLKKEAYDIIDDYVNTMHKLYEEIIKEDNSEGYEYYLKLSKLMKGDNGLYKNRFIEILNNDKNYLFDLLNYKKYECDNHQELISVARELGQYPIFCALKLGKNIFLSFEDDGDFKLYYINEATEVDNQELIIDYFLLENQLPFDNELSTQDKLYLMFRYIVGEEIKVSE